MEIHYLNINWKKINIMKKKVGVIGGGSSLYTFDDNRNRPI